MSGVRFIRIHGRVVPMRIDAAQSNKPAKRITGKRVAEAGAALAVPIAAASVGAKYAGHRVKVRLAQAGGAALRLRLIKAGKHLAMAGKMKVMQRGLTKVGIGRNKGKFAIGVSMVAVGMGMMRRERNNTNGGR
jgi:hypothetical protein